MCDHGGDGKGKVKVNNASLQNVLRPQSIPQSLPQASAATKDYGRP